jgi:hypothetical protein
MLAPPHSLHLLLMRWCWQMLASQHSLHVLLFALVLADARSPALSWGPGDRKLPCVHLCINCTSICRHSCLCLHTGVCTFHARAAQKQRQRGMRSTPDTVLASAPLVLVLADARPPALLASAPSALVRTDTVWLLLLCDVYSRFVGLLASPALAGAAVTCVTCDLCCAVTVSSTAINRFKEMTTATSGVLARFPWLLPVRNSFASYCC